MALNFDPDDLREEHAESNGWHVDRHEVDLPAEPPGPPLAPEAPRASWAVACRIVRAYEFPDPKLITGVFEPDGDLEGRPMLLRARFLAFRFWLPVRVAEVVDETRETDRGSAQVWGYSYTTLEGHFEKGQIWFEVWKWTDSGEVAFRIRAVSKPETIRNPFYRIGFKLFGRRLQLQFAHRALERMQRFVSEELAARAASVPAKPREAPEVAPASHDAEAAERLDEAERDAS
ncbi:hypothetical protein BSZ36_11410 [Rubricoccus marinus]|uniref:DUF1990 domain-containing protein n=2 Tax=Rubricoccus marinus TaxID=716817 RepID=A0A259U3X9_9BACT|nr:hypothetical protein BSZ36_11410 [Rubricoccus marinus]